MAPSDASEQPQHCHLQHWANLSLWLFPLFTCSSLSRHTGLLSVSRTDQSLPTCQPLRLEFALCVTFFLIVLGSNITIYLTSPPCWQSHSSMFCSKIFDIERVMYLPIVGLPHYTVGFERTGSCLTCSVLSFPLLEQHWVNRGNLVNICSMNESMMWFLVFLRWKMCNKPQEGLPKNTVREMVTLKTNLISLFSLKYCWMTICYPVMLASKGF